MRRKIYELPWLELALAISFIALVCELFPSLGTWMLTLLDVTTWSRTTWFGANLVLVAVLLSVRYGPEWLQAWRQAK